MRGLAAKAWAFLRELSGEAALERRLASQGGCDHPPAQRIARALEEAYADKPRCC